MSLPTLSSLRKEKANVQHRIKLIAGFRLFTKIPACRRQARGLSTLPAVGRSVFYLLTLMLKTRNKPYTTTLCFIKTNH
jgi:hypothetical protein